MSKQQTALTQEQKQALHSFIKARRARAEAETYLEENKASVFKILTAIQGGNVTIDKAMIYRADAISYTYPPAILHLEKNLNNAKKAMQLDGRADRHVKGCVKFEDLRQP